MAERLSDKLDEYLETAQGRIVSLKDIRNYLQIEPGSAFDANLRKLMSLRVEKRIVSTSGKKDGDYKVIRKVKPVSVHNATRKQPIRLNFPKDFQTMEELLFADDIVIREGDMVLISGVTNMGKTAMCLNFAAENIDMNPVLMGNEYTDIDDNPSSRFLNRIDKMNWVEWCDIDGDRFTLLPVREDYAEHIEPDKINIIDWINLPGEYYMISPLMEGIKRQLGSGIAIISIQKNPGVEYGRGGNLTKDFADVEMLIDRLPESSDVLLTIGKVKESTRSVSGRCFAYSIEEGVKITNFREMERCSVCFGKGWKGTTPCPSCDKSGYTEKRVAVF